MNGQPYWMIKNSWSTYWGNDGYVLMSMKDNNCGVATDATYVIVQIIECFQFYCKIKDTVKPV